MESLSSIRRILRVSPNRRYLVSGDGVPFFWLADTAWELLHRLGKQDTLMYLEMRRRQGFTVIQTVILAELDGLRTPNAEGEVPFVNLDPGKPNETYFQHVDWVLGRAHEQGLYVGLLPTWGDKVDRRYDWAIGPQIFDNASAANYGFFLGNRYKSYPNIVWILGGDRDPDMHGVDIWRTMAAGIIAGAGGKENTIMTFHPQPFENGSSARWFHQDAWLDFNMLQTGHDKQKNTFDLVSETYALHPPKPVLDGEPTYEAHGLGFKPAENGYSSDYEVRKYAYWSLFSGAFGHTYGCHSVWQFFDGIREGVNAPIYHWKDALHLAGANQMTHVRNLMTSRSILNRIPDQSVIIDNQPKGEDYLVATRSEDGAFAFVYSPTGKAFTINTRSLAGKLMQYRWYNPRDGVSTMTETSAKYDEIRFQPPNSGYGNDWILVIDCY